jgi:hypothetical protein
MKTAMGLLPREVTGIEQMLCQKWTAVGVMTIALVFGATGQQAQAFDDSYEAWHNGSRMLVSIEEDTFVITYEKPKRSLRKHGVRSGTVLFSGHIDGRQVEGEAFVFRDGCDPEPYQVEGTYRINRRSFTLTGASPRRETGGCEIVDYVNSGSNAALKFTRASNDSDVDGDHDDGPDDSSQYYCGWWAIYACHESRDAAIDTMNNVGYGGVVDTNNVPNFRNGYYCVADGPTTSSLADRMKNRAKRDFDSAYTKKGC